MKYIKRFKALNDASGYLLPKPYLKIMYDIMHPIIVNAQEIIKPNRFPNTKKFIVINTTRGKTGTIDSINIKEQPINAPSVPDDFIYSTTIFKIFNITST